MALKLDQGSIGYSYTSYTYVQRRQSMHCTETIKCMTKSINVLGDNVIACYEH